MRPIKVIRLNYWEPEDEFDAEQVVMKMVQFNEDWERSNYIDIIHPQYANSNPAAQAKSAVEAIEKFNCSRYTKTGWDVFRERLRAVCQYLDINPHKEVDLSERGGHDSDLYTMRVLICRAICAKARHERTRRPFPCDQQCYRMVVKDSVLYVYHQNKRYFYFIEMPNGYDYDCPDEYDSAWEALTASVEKLLEMLQQFGLDI